MSVIPFKTRSSSNLFKLVESRDWIGLKSAIETGAPVYIEDKQGLTLIERFMSISGVAPDQEERLQQHDVLRAFLSQHCKNDGSRLTPLAIASLSGRPDMVQILLDAGHDPNEKGVDGHNAASAIAMAYHTGAISIARSRKSPEISWDDPLLSPRLASLGLLCVAGLDLNEPTFNGATPLLLACLVKNTPCISYFISCGASTKKLTGESKNPIYQMDPLEVAILTLNENAVCSLTHAGARATQRATLSNDEEISLIELAGGLGQPGMLQAFSTYTPLNQGYFTAAWRSALLLGNHEVVDWFLRRGFSKDDPDQNGMRPAQVVAVGGHEVLLMHLIALGADMSAGREGDLDAWDLLKKHHPEKALFVRRPSSNQEPVRKLRLVRP